MLKAVTSLVLFETPFASPQQELFVLDEPHWRKVLRRAPYQPRNHKHGRQARQLLLLNGPLVVWFWFCKWR